MKVKLQLEATGTVGKLLIYGGSQKKGQAVQGIDLMAQNKSGLLEQETRTGDGSDQKRRIVLRSLMGTKYTVAQSNRSY